MGLAVIPYSGLSFNLLETDSVPKSLTCYQLLNIISCMINWWPFVGRVFKPHPNVFTEQGDNAYGIKEMTGNLFTKLPNWNILPAFNYDILFYLSSDRLRK